MNRATSGLCSNTHLSTSFLDEIASPSCDPASPMIPHKSPKHFSLWQRVFPFVMQRISSTLLPKLLALSHHFEMVSICRLLVQKYRIIIRVQCGVSPRSLFFYHLRDFGITTGYPDVHCLSLSRNKSLSFRKIDLEFGRLLFVLKLLSQFSCFFGDAFI